MDVSGAEHRPHSRKRSPQYPAIDLESAIQRASTLYDAEKMHPAPMAAIVGHWGYTTPKSGVAAGQYSSLKKYGLLEEEGSGDNRLGRLTQLAFEILHNPDATAQASAIETAALTPAVHRELWDEFGFDLPSDATLRYRLVNDRDFTDAGAADLIKEYRATLAFLARRGTKRHQPAQQEGSGSAAARAEAETPEERTSISHESLARQSGEDTAPASTASRPTRHSIPLAGGQQITIEGNFPLSEEAWAGFLRVLEAFKPGLVRDDERAE